MATKRLNIELPSEQYEFLRWEANAFGKTVTKVLRELIQEEQKRVTDKASKDYEHDPFYRRSGSFNGPSDLSENHDHYLYGESK